MYYRVISRLFGASLIVAASASAASAVGVTIETMHFDKSDLAAAQTAYADHLSAVSRSVVEDFEGHSTWRSGQGTTNPVTTAVGDLWAKSVVHGSGGSAVGGGVGLEVRQGDVSGRQNTTIGGSKWLDSNDLSQMIWSVGDALGPFNTLMFMLTDVGDIKGTNFSIMVDGANIEAETAYIPRQKNGAINLVRILLDGDAEDATVTLSSAHNDGFSIDDIAIAHVPLPPAALLLLAGLGGLAATRRMRLSDKAR